MTKLWFEQHEILLIKLKFHLCKWSGHVVSLSRTTAEFFAEKGNRFKNSKLNL